MGRRLITLVLGAVLGWITLVPPMEIEADPPTTRVSSSDWRLRMVSVVRDSLLVGFFMSLDERTRRPIFP
jgi:hypothetical protein